MKRILSVALLITILKNFRILDQFHIVMLHSTANLRLQPKLRKMNSIAYSSRGAGKVEMSINVVGLTYSFELQIPDALRVMSRSDSSLNKQAF